jgi:glycosyltransferase involved in cell wall biosynthesis
LGVLASPQPDRPIDRPVKRWAHEIRIAPTTAAVRRLLGGVDPDRYDAILIIDPAYVAVPDSSQVYTLLAQPADGWHAGSILGLSGHPHGIEYVSPTWMLNAEPGNDRDFTSWRVSLRACLLRTSALGSIDLPEGYETLGGFGLALGLRLMTAGYVLRHTAVLGATPRRTDDALTPADDFRVVRELAGRKWQLWAWSRSVRHEQRSLGSQLRLLPQILGAGDPTSTTNAHRPSVPTDRTGVTSATAALGRLSGEDVTVVLPTLDRYAYVRPLLSQLERQSEKPGAVIVVDQTAPTARERIAPSDYPDLCVEVLVQDEAGQCSSRNAALCRARTAYVLFLDDDDEIPPDLIEQHLRFVDATGADASCGAVNERGAARGAYTHVRVSDTFPTNNALLRRECLNGSGLFDPVYNRGARADGDLGMRLYLSGALLLYNPHAEVVHHHAPRGGLRAHGARVTTRSSSKQAIAQRNLPSTTEIYLSLRYFSDAQVRESMVIALASTLTGTGSRRHRLGRLVVQLGLLPHSASVISRRRRRARVLLRNRPPIPKLP